MNAPAPQWRVVKRSNQAGVRCAWLTNDRVTLDDATPRPNSFGTPHPVAPETLAAMETLARAANTHAALVAALRRFVAWHTDVPDALEDEYRRLVDAGSVPTAAKVAEAMVDQALAALAGVEA